MDKVDETGGWVHAQGVSACHKSHHSGKSSANCRQEVCAGVAEQARGEEHRPCDRASVDSDVVDEVTTESTDKKHK